MKKAVIVAAGRGRRLGPETDEIPKCMVRVGGRPILHRQVEALGAAGADDFVIVRGYLGDRIAAPGATRPRRAGRSSTARATTARASTRRLRRPRARRSPSS